MSDWHNSPEWIRARAYAKTVLEPVCVTCNKYLDGNDWTIDHIQPPIDGQPNHNLDNLQSMCRACNSSKGDRVYARVSWSNPKW